MNRISKFYKTLKSSDTVYSHTIIAALIAAFLLIIPLSAKLLTDEMKWSPFDFVAAWVLWFSAGFTYRLIARKQGNTMYRAAVGVAVATALFLVWANLAVGLIGNEDNPANLMYIGVLAVGFIGAIISRLQPQGMSLVLFALAFAQMLVAVIALIARLDLSPESSVAEILGVNIFFAILWSGSALLFRNAIPKQLAV
jgi:hypothetical protein